MPSDLRFPASFPHTLPGITFTMLDGDRKRITLPVPAGGVAFKDSAVYDGAEVGLGAAVGRAAIEAISADGKSIGINGLIEKGLSGAANKAGLAVFNDVYESYISSNPKKSMQNLANLMPSGISSYKFQHMKFSGATAIRSFDFTYKFVPKSEGDAMTIANIISTFQLALYPKNVVNIAFNPPRWSIKYTNSKAMAGFSTCFLTDVSVTYNGESDGWHKDGVPITTDLTITFTETKSLNQTEINALLPKPLQTAPSESFARRSLAVQQLLDDKAAIVIDKTIQSAYKVKDASEDTVKQLNDFYAATQVKLKGKVAMYKQDAWNATAELDAFLSQHGVPDKGDDLYEQFAQLADKTTQARANLDKYAELIRKNADGLARAKARVAELAAEEKAEQNS